MEVEASGAGIAVPPNNDTELKRAIMDTTEDEDLRNEYSERATSHVREHIGWNITAQKHMKLYLQQGDPG